MLKTNAVLCCFVVAIGCDRGASVPKVEPERASAQSAATRPATAPSPPLEFVERVTGGTATSERLPLIVAIHGLGDDPQNFGKLFQSLDTPARIVLPRGTTAYHGGYSWFEFDKNDPGLTSQGLEKAAARVAALLRWLSAHRPTSGRAIVTGFSQGGMLTFVLATHHPALVAEAIPVGGWLPAPLYPTEDGKKAPPIVALHGGDDTRVPLEPTERGVSILRERGYQAEIRVYPGVGHSVSREERAEWIGLLRDACERQRAAASSPAR